MHQGQGRNYKLEKKLKSGDIDDEFEIINSFKGASSQNQNAPLPIDEYAKELLYVLEKNNVTIIMGETGCGKTTKIPEYLFKASNSYKIAHILPRKIATITVAQRVAKNMNITLGKEVGYSVRFDYNYSENETRIRFLTEGMFIREVLLDPLLKQYNVIIIDDCHERTINCELIFGLLKKIFQKRPELKIIISSATLDYECYLNFFNKDSNFTSDIFLVTGRPYTVEISYLDIPVKNYILSAVLTASQIHRNNPKNSGDILVFLPGMEEINLFIEYAMNSGLDRSDVLLLPLCAGLSVDKQLQVFGPTPHNKRKIVIATNIAEASVTIENIAFVIDSCLVKMKFYSSKTDSDALFIIPASKFSIDQRAGRAGRTRPGKCYRLITEQSYSQLYVMTNPEILRNNLREYVLRLKSFGIKDINKFQTLTEPDRNTISRALETLYFLGILDDKTNLTDLGRKVSDIPIDVRLAVSLFKAGEGKFKCTEEVLIIVSMLSIQNLFFQPKDPTNLMKAKQRIGVIEGDHLTLLRMYKSWKNCRTGRSSFCKDLYLNDNAMKQVEDMITNLKLYLKKFSIQLKSTLDEDGEDIMKSITKGFIFNIAQRQMDGSYRSLRWNLPLFIHPTSVLYQILPDYVIYNDVVTTAKNYIKDCSKIEKAWILECGGSYYEDKTNRIIQERHIEEITSHTIQINKQFGPNLTCMEKRNDNNSNNSLNSILNEREERFMKKPATHNILNKNRIYMEVEKNNDYSYYFEDDHEVEDDKREKDEKADIKKQEQTQKIEEEIESITMLRRMRKRK
jgi:ATP-dependent RNA helicase DDX35